MTRRAVARNRRVLPQKLGPVADGFSRRGVFVPDGLGARKKKAEAAAREQRMIMFVKAGPRFDSAFRVSFTTASNVHGSAQRGREQFEELADDWTLSTALSSDPTRMFMHRSYQRIIALGPRAVPWIMERVADGELHWAWALEMITGAQPATDDVGDLAGLRQVWLAWWSENGHVDSATIQFH